MDALPILEDDVNYLRIRGEKLTASCSKSSEQELPRIRGEKMVWFRIMRCQKGTTSAYAEKRTAD
ncbi:Hypothetical protein CulFRC58_1879 [Corynebacterium ulcerans FRC58]|uniref:Transposase n=1 Tax=Corynebacterium ulcerans FRC58 TaxID=1408268 RepID=A0ABM5U363_CORUL|nr:Hypothetical protein CulFRC58_1879 [Corynebacterium ulcerans FRC58]